MAYMGILELFEFGYLHRVFFYASISPATGRTLHGTDHLRPVGLQVLPDTPTSPRALPRAPHNQKPGRANSAPQQPHGAGGLGYNHPFPHLYPLAAHGRRSHETASLGRPPPKRLRVRGPDSGHAHLALVHVAYVIQGVHRDRGGHGHVRAVRQVHGLCPIKGAGSAAALPRRREKTRLRLAAGRRSRGHAELPLDARTSS